jgi:hypothetical protein
MKERPILFSAPMVRAILSGAKTQTRRALRVQPPSGTFKVSTWHHPDPRPHFYAWEKEAGYPAQIAADWAHPCPYGQPGDRLWVREAFMHEPADYCWEASVSIPCRPAVTSYRADFEGDTRGAGWKPSIHMPRSLSRITLEITDIRVERLQEISEADATAEGCAWECMTPTGDDCGSAIHGPGGFMALWKSINGAESWDANPWVWCVGFKRFEA